MEKLARQAGKQDVTVAPLAALAVTADWVDVSVAPSSFWFLVEAADGTCYMCTLAHDHSQNNRVLLTGPWTNSRLTPHYAESS